MQRYLIHHDDGGTWDLVVNGDVWSVEHVRPDTRETIGLAAFQESKAGERLAGQLAEALQRAGRTT